MATGAPEDVPIDGVDVRPRRYREADRAAARDDPPPRRSSRVVDGPESAAAAFAGVTSTIADPATDRFIGGVGLAQRCDGETAVEFWVTPEERRRGAATEATRSSTEFAFGVGYGRIQPRTAFEDTAGQRVALAAGYVREGVARAAAPDRADQVVRSRVTGDPLGRTPRSLPDLPGDELADGVVTLRPMRAADATEVHPVRSSPAVVASTVTQLVPSPEKTRRHRARAPATWLGDHSAQLVVRDTTTGALAGEIGLALEDPDTAQAEIDYYLARSGRAAATSCAPWSCSPGGRSPRPRSTGWWPACTRRTTACSACWRGPVSPARGTSATACPTGEAAAPTSAPTRV